MTKSPLSQDSALSPAATIEDVRARIDELDDQIVDLIAARSVYVAQAAQLKTRRNDAAAPDRVQQVINRIRERAQMRGLSADIAEATYRAMIFAFIDWEAPRIGDASY